MNRIYLDTAATACLREEARSAMQQLLGERRGNPAALHHEGRAARRALEAAREAVAALLGADAREIVFTSGATEANNLALRGSLPARERVPHWILSAVEHPSVLRTAQQLAAQGRVRLSLAPVDASGCVVWEALERLVRAGADLLSLMWANNETGVLQPLEDAAVLCAALGVRLHSDAVQAAGRFPLDPRRAPVDLLSLSAHKLGGPMGVGALYVRHGVRLAPQITGGPQERRRRGGTENLLGIVGFGAACRAAWEEQQREAMRLTRMRDHLEAALRGAFPEAVVHGAGSQRLPHVLNMAFPGIDGEQIQLRLDARGVAVSTGAACSSGEAKASHVLLAMGVPQVVAQASIRFSLGWHTTEAEILEAARRVTEALQAAPTAAAGRRH